MYGRGTPTDKFIGGPSYNLSHCMQLCRKVLKFTLTS